MSAAACSRQNGQPSTRSRTFGTSADRGTALHGELVLRPHGEFLAAAQGLLCSVGTEPDVRVGCTRRNEWQFGLGVQHEILPRLSGEVTYNRRKYGNLTDYDTVGLGCDYFLGADRGRRASTTCMNFVAPHHDFYSVRVPADPRLPDGGGYVIKGLANQKNLGALPGAGNVTTIQNVLEYTWDGVDTNFVYRGPGGLRISGGTSTGRSLRNTCRVDGDTDPNVQGA